MHIAPWRGGETFLAFLTFIDHIFTLLFVISRRTRLLPSWACFLIGLFRNVFSRGRDSTPCRVGRSVLILNRDFCRSLVASSTNNQQTAPKVKDDEDFCLSKKMPESGLQPEPYQGINCFNRKIMPVVDLYIETTF